MALMPRAFPARAFARSSLFQQRAWNQLSVTELQKVLRTLESKPNAPVSRGMESLKEALTLLNAEAQAKKEAAAERPTSFFIVHTTGPEQIGMLAQISSAVTEAGVDILASRATLLGGDFSTMIHVRSESEELTDKMKENLDRLPGINWWLHGGSPTVHESYGVGPGRVARVLKMSGENTVGILASITRYLHKHGINVMNMASEMEQAPLGGTPTFKVRLVVDVPIEIHRADVVSGLNALGQIIGSKNMRVDSYLHCDEAE
ncbi:hypothetical protein DIPPA_29233 [Diplonema papillatum]|nr:hypothetical protein DIPPA_29233 [Diplonema papillatum]